jgi:hypothetical protein
MIRIPESLAAEIAARPEDFRPEVDQGQQVLVLGCSGEVAHTDHAGVSGMAIGPCRYPPELMVGVGEPDGPCLATAWAPVGTPLAPGDRVLAVEVPNVPAVVGRIGTVHTVVDRTPIVDFGELMENEDGDHDSEWVPTSWALLPPEPGTNGAVAGTNDDPQEAPPPSLDPAAEMIRLKLLLADHQQLLADVQEGYRNIVDDAQQRAEFYRRQLVEEQQISRQRLEQRTEVAQELAAVRQLLDSARVFGRVHELRSLADDVEASGAATPATIEAIRSRADRIEAEGGRDD